MRIMLINKSDTLLIQLRDVFERQHHTNINVVWFSDGKNAIDQLATTHFDILVTDLKTPGIQAFKLIAKAKKIKPNTQIMIHTAIDHKDAVFAAIKAGASSYMLAESTSEELATALKDLHAGGAPMSPRATRYLIKQVQDESLASSLDVLTDREKEVFQCIEEGKSYKGIGCQLSISRNTVHTHIKNIYGKLHAVNKQDALVKARKMLAA